MVGKPGEGQEKYRRNEWYHPVQLSGALERYRQGSESLTFLI